ncbi:structure-specific recognition protein-domain-containing protein [Phanerochaete sordida]|uniref:FACT complex subunit POB3 n=1 Tax=Phanerochaete sordida TaxID=48140 RepID=A0A9P3LML8_9APHY|nr:structure-specific recognition protein-domain-containing protein [Phanerochaete sordida]
MTTQFDNIYHGLSPEVGKLRIAASGMAWRGEDSQQTIAIPQDEMKWAQWVRVARNYQLRIGLGNKDKKNADRKREIFDGFARDDHDKVAQLMKQHFSIVLETKEVSVKGWNWGMTDFQGQDLVFLVSNKTAFELPLSKVANSNIAGRTEVSLEYPVAAQVDKKAARHGPDELTEIRFYVPGTHTKEARGSDAGSQKSDDEEEEISAAQAFHDAIKERAEIGQVTGDIILSFEEVLVLTPRGRYDVDMFRDFLRLRGKTYDYKILYTTIAKLFLLPKDDMHVLFILGLSTPIRQGQTRYQYLVMQFSRDEESTAELNMPEEEVEKYDRLKKTYDEPTFEVVSSVFRALSGRKIIGAGQFQSRDGHPAVKANLKAVQGDLFLLEKYIFFVSKTPTLVELSDIHQVVFSRLGAGSGAVAARTFDLKVVTKSGPEFTFTSINKEEHEVTQGYLMDKKVKVKNEMMEGELIMAGDDDDEMQSVASDGEEAPKPRAGGFDDDEDSEEDEDFHASESDAGSPTEESSDSEGGETASDASGDREFLGKGKGKGKASGKKASAKKSKAKAEESDAEDDEKPKKAAPRPKPKPKKKGSDDEAMDVDEEEKPKPKPKPKPKARELDDGPAKKKQKKSSD